MLLRSLDELYGGLRTLSKKLVAVDAQSHEHQNAKVGISCLMLLTPAIPAYYANDWLMVASTFLVTFTSLCADYLYIGTVWNVIDRWCGIGWAMYMYACAWPGLPLLSTLNALPLLGFLTFSRSAAISAVEGSRQCAKALESIGKPQAESEATDAGEARPDSEASSDSEREAKPRAPLANAAVRRLVAQRNNNHKVLQRLNAEILGHQRNVPRLDRPHDDTACGFTSLLSLWLHQSPPNIFGVRNSRSTGLICAVVLIIGLISLVLRERRLRGTAFLAKNLMEGFDNDCYQVGMYYADPVRLPNLFRSLQPDAEACQVV
ncbi:Uncharacterized protein SCF082_LOCUS36346 [Durusdinium trenchii]|uniref:Glycerophosphocholine acyltransferase 1 n=1 Tax=Durusdinium trenchii TaxID=1381693 RepID=A0ABP0PFD2_9DINO